MESLKYTQLEMQTYLENEKIKVKEAKILFKFGTSRVANR